MVWHKDFNSVIEPAHNASGKESEDISEGEIAAILQEVDRSKSYLSKFIHINFDWDKQYLSQYLQTDLSEEERRAYFEYDWDEVSDFIPDITYISQRQCKATTSLHSFKSAFGTTEMTPGQRYYFEIKCVKGSNFKIGICLSGARTEPDMAFCDKDQGWGYYSNGQTRHNSKGTGEQYGETFKGKDTIGVYVDLVSGCLFFSKNGRVYGDAF